ncbi:hypothetical protein [Aeoliella sp. SH292]|uniref:hypothetical protein n=1 Tax=Aeoliella sp. SH292 TaxID=3454464 RepID=UPI003F9E0E1D
MFFFNCGISAVVAQKRSHRTPPNERRATNPTLDPWRKPMQEQVFIPADDGSSIRLLPSIEVIFAGGDFEWEPAKHFRCWYDAEECIADRFPEVFMDPKRANDWMPLAWTDDDGNKHESALFGFAVSFFFESETHFLRAENETHISPAGMVHWLAESIHKGKTDA